MSSRPGGRPRGPERIPYTTTLLPQARAELTRRAKEEYGTPRAANRVIEAVMGFAAVQYSETEDVELDIERDEWSDTATVTVRLYSDANDEIECVAWRDEDRGPLTPSEEERAREAARRKAAES